MNYGELFKKKLIQLEFYFSVGQYRIPVDFFYTSEIQGKDGDYHRAFKIIDLKEMFSKDFKIFLDNKNSLVILSSVRGISKFMKY